MVLRDVSASKKKGIVLPPKLNAAHLEHLCEHGVSAELTREGQACKASVVPGQHQGALLWVARDNGNRRWELTWSGDLLSWLGVSRHSQTFQVGPDFTSFFYRSKVIIKSRPWWPPCEEQCCHMCPADYKVVILDGCDWHRFIILNGDDWFNWPDDLDLLPPQQANYRSFHCRDTRTTQEDILPNKQGPKKGFNNWEAA